METTMMPPDTVSLDFLARQQAQLLEEVKATRAESREVRRSFSLISDHFSRQERRIAELRDDFETMIKLEVGGAIVNLETRLENEFEARLGAVELRLSGVEGKLGALEGRLGAVEGGLNSIGSTLGTLQRGQAQLDSKLDMILAAVRPA